MPTLDDILEKYGGRPIRNCPGRYILPAALTQCPPGAIVGDGFKMTRFEGTSAKDTVIVTWIADGGLISYHRHDGSWCHTVNEPSGFLRKLSVLGIETER